MAENPVRVAFCPLLYVRNGGEIDGENIETGRIVLSTKRQYVRGKCDEAFDCGECGVLNDWLAEEATKGFHIGWECVTCLKETKNAVPQRLPGFFQSSRYRGPLWDRVLAEPERPLDGCTRCGFGTITLQLVLRKHAP